MLDTDDWSLTQDFVGILERTWGKFSLDAFANYYNAKVVKFYSLFFTPGSAGCNAFTYDWSKEFSLLVPPVDLVGRVIHHLKLCQGKGVLVVPKWSSAKFWPLLTNVFSYNIKDMIQVKGKNVLRQGLNKNSLFGSDSFNGDILAVLLDFSL